MELALHLRDFRKKDPLEVGLKHLGTFYEDDELPLNSYLKGCPHFSRVYAGDEFCLYRLPRVNEIKRIGLFCQEHHLGLSLLTPPLSDIGLENCRPLFQYLNDNMPAAEIVVNDMGVLFFMKKHYPGLSLSMGRLLNKGFKDPRFKKTNENDTVSTDVRELLNEATFDQMAVVDMALGLSVKRMERDLLPYAEQNEKRSLPINQSIYFPFGYMTTGRVCWISSFQKNGRQKFLIQDDCNQPCDELPLLLKNDGYNFKVFQNGNTLYYLYPSSGLKRLLNAETESHLRLVYQGFALS